MGIGVIKVPPLPAQVPGTFTYLTLLQSFMALLKNGATLIQPPMFRQRRFGSDVLATNVSAADVSATDISAI